MLPLSSLRLEHLLDDSFDNVDDRFTLLPHGVKLPFKGANGSFYLTTDHLVEFLVFLASSVANLE